MPEPAVATTTTPEVDSDVASRIERALFTDESTTPAPIETPTVTTDGTDETDEAGTEHSESIEQAREQTPEQAQDETPEGDEIELTSEQIAQVLKTEADHLQITEEGDLRFRTKVGDDMEYVPLPELVKSYQLEKHITQKSQKLYEEKQEFEGVKKTETEKLFTQVQEAAAVTQIMEQALLGDMKSVEGLRETNPAEWAAKRQEFADRQIGIQNVKARLLAVMQEGQTKQAEAAEKARTDRAMIEAEKLLAKVPRWTDDAVASEEIPQMQSFLSEQYGFTPEELQNIPDHRFALMALDAMKGRAVTNTKSDTLKSIKALPKIVKPGVRGGVGETQKKKQAEAKFIRLKQTGKIKDAAAILLDRM